MATANDNSAGARGEVFDVGAQQLARIYAKALIGAGESSGMTPTLLDEIQSFCAEVLDRFPAFDQVLASAMVSVPDKEGLIDRVVGGRASTTFVNFLKVAAAHGRLDILRSISRAAVELYDEMQNRVRVDVATAVPLGDHEAVQVTERLRSLLGKEPVLHRSVDPELIGGIVIRSGDTVFDGSVASQLKQLAGQMINRSVHEIQSRRDRFSHSA